MRALTLATGTLRALESLNLMGQIDAISAVSGGAWASSLYMFARKTSKELLGEATDPQALTLDTLESARSVMQDVATRPVKQFLGALFDHQPSNLEDLWNQYVATMVLWPAELRSPGCEGCEDAQYSFLAASEEHKKSILERNQRLNNNSFLLPNPNRSQLLVISASVLAPLGHMATNNSVVSLQISPDFTGSPFHPDWGPLTYKKIGGGTATDWVGGVMEETFAFDNAAPRNLTWIDGELAGGPLPEPSRPFSLMRALGATSVAAGGLMSNYRSWQHLDPVAKIWPAGVDTSSLHQAAEEFKLGDGGNLENTGLLAMLQRGVKKNIVLLTLPKGLPATSDFNWCHHSKENTTYKQIQGAIHPEILSLFGYVHDSPHEETRNSWLRNFWWGNNKVFQPEDLFKLACKGQELRDAGKPAVVRMKHIVRKNRLWGIAGGWETEVVYIMNEKVQDFEDALPDETRDSLGKGILGDFDRFPFFLTVFQVFGQLTSYTNKQHNLLAAQAEYTILAYRDLIRVFLKD